MMKKTIITFFVTFFYLNNAHGSENLTVSVASSLYNVSHELAREWEKTSNKKVVIISGSTSLLARQFSENRQRIYAETIPIPITAIQPLM